MQTLPFALTMTTANLAAFLEKANAAYRSGNPIMSDHAYDHTYLAELARRSPAHTFLTSVEKEPEVFASATEKVIHKRPMLSTDKAYDLSQLQGWINRIEKAAAKLSVSPIITVLPKLDGMAGRYEDGVLASRGDGLVGTNLNKMLERGVVALGGANTGDGEIVLEQAYYDAQLSAEWAHPRNCVTGIAGADKIKSKHEPILLSGAIRFVPYSTLDGWTGTPADLISQYDAIYDQVSKCEYPVDGVVATVTSLEIQRELGSTSHHHCFQIAIKRKNETAQATVKGVTWQVGRKRVSPVIEIEPVKLSGATISRITGHHREYLRQHGIGKGAVLLISRKGEVIPGHESTLVTADHDYPTHCPVCSSALVQVNDFLECHGSECEGKASSKLEHFFRLLGNVDLFGPKTCNTLVESGVTDIRDVYALTSDTLENMGFGSGQAANLIAQLLRSRTELTPDWKFLSAFGISDLGRGDSKKLLRVHPIEELGVITADQIQSIEGFGAITAPAIASQINARWVEISELLGLGFNLDRTVLAASKQTTQATISPLSGKRIVFTGSMESGSREDMQRHAETLGAISQSGSVNKKTDVLVTGKNVGQVKLNKAAELGVRILTEAEYLALVNQ